MIDSRYAYPNNKRLSLLAEAACYVESCCQYNNSHITQYPADGLASVRRVDSACYESISIQSVTLPMRICGCISLSDNWLSRSDNCEEVCSEDSADSVASALNPSPTAAIFPQTLLDQPVRKENGGYSCRECYRNLKSVNGFKRHMMIHTGEKPFACNDCDKRFRQQSHLKNHFLSQHSEVKEFKCEVCEHPLSTRSSLCMHMKSKHPK